MKSWVGLWLKLWLGSGHEAGPPLSGKELVGSRQDFPEQKQSAILELSGWQLAVQRVN